MAIKGRRVLCSNENSNIKNKGLQQNFAARNQFYFFYLVELPMPKET
jgi:hypothetical protein